MRRARSGNLTALLVAVAVLEFFVNRLAGRLFFPRPTLASGGSQTTHVVSVAGPFLFQLTAILALAVMAAAFFGLFRRGELYPRAVRFSVVVIALFFAALSAQAIVQRPRPPALFPLSGDLLRVSGRADRDRVLADEGGAAREDRRRAVCAARARCAHSGSSVPAWDRAMPGTPATAASRLAAVARARWRMLIGGMRRRFLLPPRPSRERRWRLPPLSPLVAIVAFVTVLLARFDLMQASALYGLRSSCRRCSRCAGSRTCWRSSAGCTRPSS